MSYRSGLVILLCLMSLNLAVQIRSLNLTSYRGLKHQMEGQAGWILCFITDVDIQLNGRLSKIILQSDTDALGYHLSEIGIRLGTDKIRVSADPKSAGMSIQMHDEELPHRLTVKLAGGSLRIQDGKLTIKLSTYFIKIGVNKVKGSQYLVLEALYRPNPQSESQGLLAHPLSDVTDFRIKDGDIWGLDFPKTNFSVTDLWKQKFGMSQDAVDRSKKTGWQTQGAIH